MWIYTPRPSLPTGTIPPLHPPQQPVQNRNKFANGSATTSGKTNRCLVWQEWCRCHTYSVYVWPACLAGKHPAAPTSTRTSKRRRTITHNSSKKNVACLSLHAEAVSPRPAPSPPSPHFDWTKADEKGTAPRSHTRPQEWRHAGQFTRHIQCESPKWNSVIIVVAEFRKIFLLKHDYCRNTACDWRVDPGWHYETHQQMSH